MLNIVVIGCGYWGKNLVRNYHAMGLLCGICDDSPETAKAISEKYHVPAFTLDQIWQDPNIHAVVISTPAITHAELSIKAIQSGKHIYVEKPMAIDLDEAKRVVDAYNGSNQIYMVGHLLQYHLAFMKLKEIVQENRLGKLNYIYSNRLNLGKLRREENILWSFAPHDISMILSLVNSDIKSVDAVGTKILNHKIYDITTTYINFSNEVKAHIYVSWLHPYKEQKLVVIGEKGMAVFNDCLSWDQKLQIYSGHLTYKNSQPDINKVKPECIPLDESEPLRLECEHFVHCINNSKQPRTDINEAFKVLTVLEMAEKSMLTTEKSGLKYFAHESSYIDQPCEIGEGTKIWHFTHILPNVRIGRNCIIGQSVSIGADVIVGNRCKIQNNVSLYKGVILEDGVFCGPSSVFTNVINPRAEVERKNEFRKTLVRRGVTIGANATILCGIELGEYSFIAAGAVVTKDVPAFALMAGVPARRIGWMSRSGERLDDALLCPRTGARYRKVSSNCLEEIDV